MQCTSCLFESAELVIGVGTAYHYGIDGIQDTHVDIRRSEKELFLPSSIADFESVHVDAG